MVSEPQQLRACPSSWSVPGSRDLSTCRRCGLFILPELLKAVEAEPENDVLAELLASLARCVELLGAGCLGEPGMEETVKILDKTMTEHYKRQEEDYDEGVEEQLEDEDDEDVYILSKVGDVVHAVFSQYKETWLPQFERLSPSSPSCWSPPGPGQTSSGVSAYSTT
eukprot:TRINITY_DN13817_c0_g1_i1.p1 TRINITY_DN13817_c0_g1~~TRINITY_DN13817_c0_g1_i1.p1  ORF type:complete len:167 (+),score=49.89 TRINITY_DN13817_c0_g1_i1:167-667(+)